MTLKFYKKIEGIANLAIILVAALLSVVLVKNYLWPVPKDSSPRTAEDIVGKKLPVPEIDWAANGRTLLLVLQTNCRYCTESAPFYKELVKGQSAGSDLKLVAVFPNSVDDAKAYLQSVGVSINEVRQAPLNRFGVSGTPTILLVDSSGVVKEVWRGRLDSAREREVLARL